MVTSVRLVIREPSDVLLRSSTCMPPEITRKYHGGLIHRLLGHPGDLEDGVGSVAVVIFLQPGLQSLQGDFFDDFAGAVKVTSGVKAWSQSSSSTGRARENRRSGRHDFLPVR